MLMVQFVIGVLCFIGGVGMLFVVKAFDEPIDSMVEIWLRIFWAAVTMSMLSVGFLYGMDAVTKGVFR